MTFKFETIFYNLENDPLKSYYDNIIRLFPFFYKNGLRYSNISTFLTCHVKPRSKKNFN